MDLAIRTEPLPGTGGDTWPITDDQKAVEQFLIDTEMPICELQQDEFIHSLGPDYPRGPAGMYGLGAAAVSPQQVKVPLAQPVKTSTIYLVAGGAALLVIGAIAFFAWRAGD